MRSVPRTVPNKEDGDILLRVELGPSYKFNGRKLVNAAFLCWPIGETKSSAFGVNINLYEEDLLEGRGV